MSRNDAYTRALAAITDLGRQMFGESFDASSARIDKTLSALLNQGLTCESVQRPRARVGFHTMDTMLRRSLFDTLQFGSKDGWTRVLQSHLFCVAMLTLGCRIGELARSDGYHADECLHFTDVIITVDNAFTSLAHMAMCVKCAVTLRAVKGNKQTAGGARCKVQPMPTCPHLCFITALLVHAARLGLVNPRASLNELFLQAKANPGGLLVWNGDCTVFLKQADQLTDDASSLGYEAATSASTMDGIFQRLARRVGLLAPVTSHAIRRGAARDAAEVPRNGLPGLNVEASANLMGHAPTTMKRHVTEDIYIGKRREASDNMAKPALATTNSRQEVVRKGKMRNCALNSRAQHATSADFQLPFSDKPYSAAMRMNKAQIEAAFVGVPVDPSLQAGQLVAGVLRSNKEMQRVRGKLRKKHWQAFPDTEPAAVEPNPSTSLVRWDMLSMLRMPGAGADAIAYAEFAAKLAAEPFEYSSVQLSPANGHDEDDEDDEDDDDEAWMEADAGGDYNAGEATLHPAFYVGGDLEAEDTQALSTNEAVGEFFAFYASINTMRCESLAAYFRLLRKYRFAGARHSVKAAIPLVYRCQTPGCEFLVFRRPPAEEHFASCTPQLAKARAEREAARVHLCGMEGCTKTFPDRKYLWKYQAWEHKQLFGPCRHPLCADSIHLYKHRPAMKEHLAKDHKLTGKAQDPFLPRTRQNRRGYEVPSLQSASGSTS